MSQPRLRLRLKPAAEKAVRSGHPWIYASGLREQNRVGTTGELAVIYDRADRFLAVGLFDDNSPLRVRVLHCGEPVTIDADWFQQRLHKAWTRRASLLSPDTNGFRLINGESDGWPALVLDRYSETLVLKLYSGIWWPYLPRLVPLIATAFPAARIILRLSRNLAASAHHESPSDGQILSGAPLTEPVVFLENGLRFEADVIRGQKTGFFLDQRDNRSLVRGLARNGDVLNAFSFSGGFSVSAAAGGARSTTDLDISAHALAGAARNFSLNLAHPALQRCRREAVQTDAFDWLAGNRERMFDLVIADPPSLAKREVERERAIDRYRRLAADAIRHVKPGGMLVAASCSAHVNADEFLSAVKSSATVSRRRFAVWRVTGHPADHPATFAEARYLKCVYLRL